MIIRNLWQKSIRDLQHHYSENLVTIREFEDDIKKIVNHPNSPLNGLLFSIKCDSPFENFEIGIRIPGDPTYADTIENSGNRKLSISIKSWCKSGFKGNYSELFGELFNNFWKPDVRASPSGLISIKDFRPEVTRFSQNTLDMTIKNKSFFSILYGDLDNFKKVNDTLGKEVGDELIQKVAAILEKISGYYTILLNNGGDEFVILYPNGSSDDAILLAFEIKKKIQTPEFIIKDIKVDMSIGIDTNTNFDDPKSISDLINNSESTVVELKTKKRGLTRIYKDNDIKILERNIEESLNLSLCITKSCALDSNPYQNVWLNAISKNVAQTINRGEFSSKLIKHNLEEFVKWSDFSFNTTIKTSYVDDVQHDTEPVVSILDIIIAGYHGIQNELLKNAKIKKLPEENEKIYIKYNDQLSEAALISSSGEIIFSFSSDIKKLSKTFDLGYLWRSKEEMEISSKCLCIATLIKIGYEKISLPKKIFDEVIIIDDRPVKGGGLPDFWELTIARLIDQLSKNPNIFEIFLIGKQDYASRTIEKLKSYENWNDADIHKKTGIPISVINTTKKKFNKFNIITEENELLNKLAVAIRETKNIVPICSTSLDIPSRILKRDLDLENLSLTKDDGCKVGTIREAFPIMLEIARNCRKNENTIIDQAGRQIQELVDFKVLLSNPSNQCVPDFYAKEEESLINYFKVQFLDEKRGLFARILKEDDQIERVLDHTVDAINSNPPFATRRSILVVPHKQSKEIAPLGLVSVRIIPRFNENKITLNYSFTWRTVEALVGFPYSIYGSVKYSEFLTERIKQKLPEETGNKVCMGFVSYIAHSLHIFSDEYSQNIARSIISDASI